METGNNKRATASKSRTVRLNKQIVSYGKQRNWREILNLYKQNHQDFSSVNFATAMSNFGRIRSLDVSHPLFRDFVDDLSRKMVRDEKLSWIGIREASNIVHAIGKLRLRSKSAREIINWICQPNVVAIVVRNGSTQEVASTAWAFATLGVNAPRLFAEIENHAEWLVQEGIPRDISNTVWACAKLDVNAPRLFSEIENHADWLVREGKPQDIANTAWASATLGVNAPRLFSEIENHAAWVVREGNPQNIANTVWAFATLGTNALRLLSEIENHAEWLVREGIPRDISNAAWASATLGVNAPRLFSEIENHADRLVREGNAQDIANTAWACATLGVNAPRLFSEIDNHAELVVREGNPQEVASTAWAFATLGTNALHLLSEIENHADRLGREGNAQDIANTAWACATLGVNAPRLFSEIENRAEWLVREGSPQQVANTAWACAVLGVNAPRLFSEIDNHADRLVREGNPQNVANTAWACATLGFDSSSLFSWLQERMKEKSGRNCFDCTRDIPVILYSIAVSGYCLKFESLLRRLWSMALQYEDQLESSESMQVVQALEYSRAQGIDLKPPSDTFLERIQHSERPRNIVTSAQRTVSRILDRNGIENNIEVSPFSTAEWGDVLAIDIASKEIMLAIEFDGPSHYLKEVGTGNISSYENGTTRAKRRLLQQLGWTVVNIDYRDWGNAGNASGREKFLCSKLNATGISLPLS